MNIISVLWSLISALVWVMIFYASRKITDDVMLFLVAVLLYFIPWVRAAFLFSKEDQ